MFVPFSYRQRVGGNTRHERRESVPLEQSHEDRQDLEREARRREVDLPE